MLLLQNLGFGAYEKTAAAETSDGVTSQRKAQLMMGFEVNDKTEDEEIQELIEMNENLQHVESRDIQDYGQSSTMSTPRVIVTYPRPPPPPPRCFC